MAPEHIPPSLHTAACGGSSRQLAIGSGSKDPATQPEAQSAEHGTRVCKRLQHARRAVAPGLGTGPGRAGSAVHDVQNRRHL